MFRILRIFALTLPLLFSLQQAHAQFLITTVAGGGLPNTPLPALNGTLANPQGVAIGEQGSVYFSAQNCVWKIDALGILTRVAGVSAAGGYSGDGGLATRAALNTPTGLVLDSAGNLYIADTYNNRIRKVAGNGVITTVAGNGNANDSGDGGLATAARLNQPTGVALDSAGNLFIADEYDNSIRMVATNGTITTVAGTTGTYGGSPTDGGLAAESGLGLPYGVVLDANNNLYFTDLLYSVVRKVTPTGVITTIAGGMQNPHGLSIDKFGNLYMADYGNELIRKVTPDGIMTTVAGNKSYGYSGDGSPAINASLYAPQGVAVDANGNILIADTLNNRIRKVAVGGIIATVTGGASASVGDGGVATSAAFSNPYGVAVDSSGNIYIADSGNARVRKVATNGTVTTVAGNGIPGNSGNGGAAVSAQLVPWDVAVDLAGNLYIADWNSNVIRKVATSGIITSIAGSPFGAAGYGGDGGQGTSALLTHPVAVAVDSAGNLYIADEGNNVIRKLQPNGIITTVAGSGAQGYSGDGGPAVKAQLSGPSGVAVDATGNIYVADTYNGYIRKITAHGTITSIAGNGSYGAGVSFGFAQKLTVSSTGELYIADFGNSAIRKISTAGVLTNVAGNGTPGYSGDGGDAATAEINLPYGVAADTTGHIYIADQNNVVRMLVPQGDSAVLQMSLTHSGNFAPGQQNATYSLVVRNAANAAPTNGSILVALTLPPGIVLTGLGGEGWACAGSTCARSDALGPGSSYPPLTAAVSVATGAPSQATVQATLSGGGSHPTSVSDVTAIVAVPVGPAITAGGVVNAASYATTVAPGSIASAFGNFLLSAVSQSGSIPLPTKLGGLSVLSSAGGFFPLVYTSGSQLILQVPWELGTQAWASATPLLVQQAGPVEDVAVVPFAPGIFAMNGQGYGQGAIVDASNRLADSVNLAAAGNTVVVIYCTGLGAVTNQPATGSPAPSGPFAETVTPPTVSIGGAAATVLFSGLTPGSVGLYQVNALVPTASMKGSAVPVSLSIGGTTSNIVTIGVR